MLVSNFIREADLIANDLYSWEKAETEFISAIQKTYSYDELVNINSWLSSKYGSLYIQKQQLFFKENLAILGSISNKFQGQLAPKERKMVEELKALTQK